LEAIALYRYTKCNNSIVLLFVILVKEIVFLLFLDIVIMKKLPFYCYRPLPFFLYEV